MITVNNSKYDALKNVKELGESFYLDSGTLTPLLKKLESKGMLTRKRSDKDERNLIVTITEEEGMMLYRILYKILEKNLSEE